ncbi:hypothetical protein [Hymenobacter sp.]|uniref:hypothetical protein n=1 Tax=Hymenobacter sp. TaxID=1898978 RepID=UPI002EDBB059
MTRSRLTRHLGQGALLWLLVFGSGQSTLAQPRADSLREAPLTSVQDTAAVVAPGTAVEAESSNWPLILGVLGGIALGVLGARMWSRSSRSRRSSRHRPAVPETSIAAAEPVSEPVRKKPAENVPRGPKVQSLRGVQTPPNLPPPAKVPPKPQTGGKPKNKSNKPNQPTRSESWPAISPRSAMNPSTPTGPPAGDDQPLETGQTVEWSAPTSTPPAIQELIDSTANEIPIDRDARVESLEALEAAAAAAAPAASTGPLHYYAPAPDVPSIEHRKFSPNPLPQMPLLITLLQADATTAQFSFSPQADQSRIIGNGVRELKEFFAFELPPTEQFTTIKNLAPGKLEKRDDTWHVVQKAGIALS